MITTCPGPSDRPDPPGDVGDREHLMRLQLGYLGTPKHPDPTVRAVRLLRNTVIAALVCVAAVSALGATLHNPAIAWLYLPPTAAVLGVAVRAGRVRRRAES